MLELVNVLESSETTACLRNAAGATAMGAAVGACVCEVEESVQVAPSRNGRCANFSTSETDRARSTTELKLPARPTQQLELLELLMRRIYAKVEE